jgi:hypothetical protein
MTTPDWTPDQRRAAAADLCERAAAALRASGGLIAPDIVIERASAILSSDTPNGDYRAGLEWLDVERAAREAAVAAILAGKHPPDSLAGRIEANKGKAEQDLKAEVEARRAICFDDESHPLHGLISSRLARFDGEVHALGAVLDWIGCPTPPTTTPEATK